MNSAKEPMTEYGYKKLTHELSDLRKRQRPDTIHPISFCRPFNAQIGQDETKPSCEDTKHHGEDREKIPHSGKSGFIS